MVAAASEKKLSCQSVCVCHRGFHRRSSEISRQGTGSAPDGHPSIQARTTTNDPGLQRKVVSRFPHWRRPSNFNTIAGQRANLLALNATIEGGAAPVKPAVVSQSWLPEVKALPPDRPEGRQRGSASGHLRHSGDPGGR
jgi:hypothetical protein